MRPFPAGRWRIFLLVVSFAIGFCSQGLHAQDLSASDVLKKISETYRSVSSYSVVGEKKVVRGTDNTAMGPLHGRGPGAIPEEHEKHDAQFTLLSSNPSKANFQLKEGRKKIVVVSDGKLVWTLDPARHEYRELALESDIAGMGLVQNYESLFVTRFQDLSSYEASAKLEHPEILRVGKDKKECYVLTIQRFGDAQEQKLWVDKTKFIVWKTVGTTVSGTDNRYIIRRETVTVTTKQMALNPSLADSNFVFTPSGQARKVDSLEMSFYGYEFYF